MPNIKSASKRVELSKVAAAANKANKTALKTAIKKFDTAVTGGSKEEAAAAYTVAVKAIDKATVKGLIHKNNAAHKKSRLTLSHERDVIEKMYLMAKAMRYFLRLSKSWLFNSWRNSPPQSICRRSTPSARTFVGCKVFFRRTCHRKK